MVALCDKCGQACLAEDAWTIRGYCALCRDAHYGGDERHETARLFEPTPVQMPGQLELEGGPNVG